jgi:cell division protein FtsZ
MAGVMRVSVVATGIDVSAEQQEVPAPRRSLSRPLEREEPAAAPEPEVQPEPQEHYETPAPTEVAPAAEDGPLFAQAEDAEPPVEDDLPPPAYQPRRAEPEAPAARAEPEPAPEHPAAAQAPGTPSPEARARLEQAVRRAPRPAGEAAREVEDTQADKSRFGINSLINRMTGHEGGQKAQPAAQRRTPPTLGGAESPSYDHDDEADPDQERIEIPAFLRRQAN